MGVAIGRPTVIAPEVRGRTNIRSFAPDLVEGGDDEALPPTLSQERRWTRAIRPRLAEWVLEVAPPLVAEELERTRFLARVRADGERLWHDLVRLDNAGIAAMALADRELALSVARHKGMFFRENDSNPQPISGAVGPWRSLGH